MKKRQVKIFRLRPMKNTPFESVEGKENKLLKHGITFVDDYESCDIVVNNFIKKIQEDISWFGGQKKYLVYTREPKWNRSLESRILFKGTPIHIMNVYTGNVWQNNYSSKALKRIVPLYSPKVKENIGANFSRSKGKKIAALHRRVRDKKQYSTIKDGQELDLSYFRCEVALAGYQLGQVDIYGNGWEEIALDDSHYGTDWRTRKWRLLKDYHFNLCMENTNVDYYCSEKIWDSIQAGCLPIYYGKRNKIYEDFPKNSFIDYADFDKPEELFEFIENMSFATYKERLLKCFEVQERIYKKITDGYDYLDQVEPILQKLDLMMAEPPPFFLRKFFVQLKQKISKN